MEAYFFEKLREMIPDFNMEVYAQQIEERKEEIDESLLDLLDSFTEFQKFKDLMLDYKRMEVSKTPKHKPAKAAFLEEPDTLQVIEGMEFLHISGEKKRMFKN